MADQRKGGIAWCDETWNPIRGCSRVSPGCQHCYAELVAARFSGPGQPYEGLAERRSNGEPRWTGKVRLITEHLHDPISWGRPRRIFVNSMSDLFHESLPDEAIDRIVAVMAWASHHTFQVLTKRVGRMLAYSVGLEALDPQERAMRILRSCYADTPVHIPEDTFSKGGGVEWPLPNVWLGASVEDQPRADERLPLLCRTPAAVHFVSYEPALAAVDFSPWLHIGRCPSVGPAPERFRCGLPADHSGHDHSALIPSSAPWFGKEAIDWIIIGGESGPRARPFDVSWARQVIAQCRIAGVACFMKQMGRNVIGDHQGFLIDTWWNKGWRYVPPVVGAGARGRPENALGFSLFDRAGAKPDQWPKDLRVREFPTAAA